ncbi:MAG TPA: hypothetical protein VLF71_01160 [Candidatus Saccharimonadales bacterium]|nr:hypothetical protein [Candidatus Saccharimonadales bacterium]
MGAYTRRAAQWGSANYTRLYAGAALLVLCGSALEWSLAAARAQQPNADQLVGGYLFENGRTFMGADFPAPHTQLIKWPLFALLRLFGFSAGAYAVCTVLVVMATLGALVYLLYRLDRRPLAWGTWCLALGSVLAVVPVWALGHGVTTPLGWGMLTGRNLEYVAYFAALALLARAQKAGGKQLLGVAGLLAVLTASDALFVRLAIGGAALLLVAAWTAEQRALQKLAARWLLGALFGWMGGTVLLALVARMTHLVPDPLAYGWIRHSDLLLPAATGTARAMGLNLGLTVQAGALVAPAVIVNAVVAVGMAGAAFRLLGTLRFRDADAPLSKAAALAWMALATSAAAVIGYIALNQPHVADARYLGVVLFSGFIVAAAAGRSIRLLQRTMPVLGAVLAVAVLLAASASAAYTQRNTDASLPQQRNRRIAQALAAHHVTFLAGDYWRVFPVRLLSGARQQAVVPLVGCWAPSPVLNSAAWRPDLRVHSFAYLLQLQGGGASRCPEADVTRLFGSPSSSELIAGTRRHPQEMLLFYDHGAAARRPMPAR